MKKVDDFEKGNFKAIKKELMARKVELEVQLAQLAKEKVTNDVVQDPGDMAVTSTMESLKISLQDAEKREYDRILQALAKIEDGSYGLCIDCGRQIGDKRLKSSPNSSRCLMCQELFEERD